MKITQLTGLAVLALAILMLSMTAITAQEEPKPEPEIEEADGEVEGDEKAEEAEKPLWDDGSRVSRFIKKREGMEELLENNELTQKRIDYLTKHAGGFALAVMKPEKSYSEGEPIPISKVVDEYQTALDSEDYKKFIVLIGEKDAAALLKSYLRFFTVQEFGKEQKTLIEARKETEFLEKNAEVLKDISKKEYEDAKKKIAKELEVITAQQDKLKAIFDPSAAEIKLASQNKSAFEKSAKDAIQKLRNRAENDEPLPEAEAEDDSDTDPESDE